MHKERKDFSREALLKRTKSILQESVQDPISRASKYSIQDCLMSGVAIYALKYPSLLQFEQHLKQEGIISKNIKNLFAVKDVPSDTQLRERLDVINYEQLQPVFDGLLYDLQRGKILEDFKYLDGYYLAAIDGTGYFASDTIHCANCVAQLDKKTGEATQYLHSMLSVVLIHPDQKCVFPLALEQINHNDGCKKNDCETNAAKRLLPKLKKAHPFLKLVITLDALYATGAMIQLLNELGYEYIIVTKDTKYLQQHISGKNTQAVEFKRGSMVKSYQYNKQLPLNRAYPDKLVNYIEYRELVPDNLKKANFIIIPDVLSLSSALPEYKKALAIINHEGQVYANPTAELKTIIYCPGFNEAHNTIKKELQLDLELSKELGTAFKKDKDLYRLWYEMQNICSRIKKTTRTSYKTLKGDVLVVYDCSLKHSTEALLPKLRLVLSQHRHVGYYNSWITEIVPTRENIELLEKGGRSKWHIENQTFNTLKNQGYNFGHNFGHGYKYLSIVMCYLMFIAFEIDQIQEHCGYYFNRLRKVLKSKVSVWEAMRSGFFMVVCSNWSELYENILRACNALADEENTS